MKNAELMGTKVAMFCRSARLPSLFFSSMQSSADTNDASPCHVEWHEDDTFIYYYNLYINYTIQILQYFQQLLLTAILHPHHPDRRVKIRHILPLACGPAPAIVWFASAALGDVTAAFGTAIACTGAACDLLGFFWGNQK